MPTSQADYQQIVIESLRHEIAKDNPSSPHLANPSRLREIAGRIMLDLHAAGLVITTEPINLALSQKEHQANPEAPYISAAPFADHTAAGDEIAPQSIDSAL